MKIAKNVFEQLMCCPDVPPEMGGIIGAMRMGVINHVFFDQGPSCEKNGIYRPNIVILNKTIEQWQNTGIIFCGIFHTHAPQWPTLSEMDKEYIRKIMEVMPQSCNELYFPLVVPGQYVKSFLARKEHNDIVITQDNINIF